jgi:hypothetical protein
MGFKLTTSVDCIGSKPNYHTTTTVHKHIEDMKTVLRQLKKKMVKVALSTSLLHKVFTLAELERAHSVLHRSLIDSVAEEDSGMEDLLGNYIFTPVANC